MARDAPNARVFCSHMAPVGISEVYHCAQTPESQERTTVLRPWNHCVQTLDPQERTIVRRPWNFESVPLCMDPVTSGMYHCAQTLPLS